MHCNFYMFQLFLLTQQSILHGRLHVMLLAMIVITQSQQPSASPDIFISYQWDKQREVTALYNKLTGLGYSCWLDVMQIGGGDSLYEKIDSGIRGCRVLLACITRRFALSPSCRSETFHRVEQQAYLIFPQNQIFSMNFLLLYRIGQNKALFEVYNSCMITQNGVPDIKIFGSLSGVRKLF